MNSWMLRSTLVGWLLALVVAVSSAHASSVHVPRYDEQQLRERFQRWVDGLDALSLATAYPELIRKLLSADPGKQSEALRMLGASTDARAIPWLLPWLDAKDPQLRVGAGSAVSKIVSDLVYRPPRDPVRRAAELKPLAWLVLHMLKAPDDGNTRAYAADMAAMLNLSEFTSELRRSTSSAHPAVAQSAKMALEALAKEQSAAD